MYMNMTCISSLIPFAFFYSSSTSHVLVHCSTSTQARNHTTYIIIIDTRRLRHIRLPWLPKLITSRSHRKRTVRAACISCSNKICSDKLEKERKGNDCICLKMSFPKKLEESLSDCASAVKEWESQQLHSVEHFLSLVNIRQQLEAFESASVNEVEISSAFPEATDKLLMKEVQIFNNLISKLKIDVSSFSSLVTTLKRSRKRAWRVLDQNGFKVVSLMDSSATEFSMADKMRWLDTLEHVFSQEFAIKEGVLSTIGPDDSVESLKRKMELWKEQSYVANASGCIQQLMHATSN